MNWLRAINEVGIYVADGRFSGVQGDQDLVFNFDLTGLLDRFFSFSCCLSGDQYVVRTFDLSRGFYLMNQLCTALLKCFSAN